MELQASTCTDGVVVCRNIKVSCKGSKKEEPPDENTGAVTPSPPKKITTNTTAKSTAMQSAPTSSTTSSDPQSIPDSVLNLSFPRCCCCKSGWYDEEIEYHSSTASSNDNNNFLQETRKKKPSSAGKRKRHRNRPSHYNLLPLPKCSCITRLALPHHLPPDILFSTTGEDDYYCNNKEEEDPLKILSRIQTHSFQNLPICVSCLKGRIAASTDITEHDYRQEHIPNGQPNVRFTVEPDCVQCKRKFRIRELEKLLLENSGGDGGGDSSKNSKNKKMGGSSSSSSSRKKKGKLDNVNWWDAVEATIQLVGWAKRDGQREKRRVRRHRKAMAMNDSSSSSEGDGRKNDQIKVWWENHNGFSGGGVDCSSDECYSLSSDSDDESLFNDDSRPTTNGPHRVELKTGELMNEWMQRDPKLRQEMEDEKYVRKLLEKEGHGQTMAAAGARTCQEDEQYAKKLMEEEEENRKAAEARAQADHELALKMQEDFNKIKPKIQPVKTRSKNPILNAWGKTPTSSAKKSDKKPSSPPAVEFLGVSHQKHAVNPSGARSNNGLTLSTPSSACNKPAPGGEASRPSQSPIHINGPEPKQCKQSKPKASPSVAATASANDASIEDGAVDEIVSMGFSEASARQCLKDAEGNVEVAVSMLLSEASGS